MKFTYVSTENETSFDRNYRRYIKDTGKNIEDELKKITSNPLSARLLKRILFDTQYGMSINLDTEATPFAAMVNQIKPLMGWTGITNRYGQMVCKKLPRTISMYYHILDSVNKYNRLKRTMNLRSLLPSETVDIKSVIWSFYMEYVEDCPDDTCNIYMVSYESRSTFYPEIDLSDIKWRYSLGYYSIPCDAEYIIRKYDPTKINPDKKHFINKYVNR